MSNKPVSVNLKKGLQISLEKSYTEFTVGVGWVDKDMRNPVDVDVCAIMLDAQNNILESNPCNFIFYSNKKSADGAITHNGDARVGGSDVMAENESIVINTSKINPNCVRVLFFLTYYDPKNKQKFTDVSDIRTTLYGNREGSLFDLCTYRPDAIEEAAKVFDITELNRDAVYKDNWYFKALGVSSTEPLSTYIERFGMVDDNK